MGTDVVLIPGEVVEHGERRFHVRAADVDAVAAMRDYLIDAAQEGATVTYGELVDELGLPVPARGLGRLLVLLSEDCERRGEPTLAALVVTRATGEVGEGYGAGALEERRALGAYWQCRRRSR